MSAEANPLPEVKETYRGSMEDMLRDFYTLAHFYANEENWDTHQFIDLVNGKCLPSSFATMDRGSLARRMLGKWSSVK